MAAKSKAYEQFGHYILFKKLEGDVLSELWRATRIENDSMGATVALRRFIGGNREALSAAAWTARQIVPSLTGTSFVKNQIIDSVGGTTFVAHEYAGGRSLRHIIDRARGGTSATPHPIPIEQAIVIAEKVALSLATTEELRMGGERLTHGALIPHFVWITDGGEIRLAGQQLGRGVVSSLRVATDLSHYFAPEYQQSGIATKASEVFSLGAILYLVVTGEEPPDATNVSAFAHAVRAAKMMAGTPMPDDIRTILDKSLTIDPGSRYGSVADMKAALSTLVNSGRYAATTFNLAFYLSTLLKKELEGESIDRDREAKTNVAPYVAALAAPPATAAVPEDVLPAKIAPGAAAGKKRSKLPLAIAATVVLAAAGVGAWLTLGAKQAPTAAARMNLAGAVTPPVTPALAAPAAPPVVEPLVASVTPAETAAPAVTATTSSEEAAKKAFEEAVKQKLQQELAKLQAEYTRELQQKQSRNAPIVTATAAPSPAAPPEELPLTAAQLDQLRREALRQSEEAAPAMTATVESAPQIVTQTTAPVLTTQAPVPAPVVPAPPVIREGDVVDGASLDVSPRVVRVAQPTYPPVAARQRITGTVLVSALISENGDVIDVKILKGEGRLGFDDAAVRAVRSTKFSPAMKDGKRVKTWLGVPIQFKP